MERCQQNMGLSINYVILIGGRVGRKPKVDTKLQRGRGNGNEKGGG